MGLLTIGSGSLGKWERPGHSAESALAMRFAQSDRMATYASPRTAIDAVLDRQTRYGSSGWVGKKEDSVNGEVHTKPEAYGERKE